MRYAFRPGNRWIAAIVLLWTSLLPAAETEPSVLAASRASSQPLADSSTVETAQDVPFLPEARRKAMRLPIDKALPGAMDIYMPKDLAKAAMHTAEEVRKGRQALPLFYVDKGDPPTLVFHGDRDRVVPYRRSAGLVAKLKAAGVSRQFVTFKGKGHSTIYQSNRTGVDDHAIVVRFLREHLEGKATTRSGGTLRPMWVARRTAPSPLLPAGRQAGQ